MKEFIKKMPFSVAIYLVFKKLVLGRSFLKEYLCFKTKNKEVNFRFNVRWKDRYLCLFDKTEKTGFDSHYIYHTAWAARILKESNVNEHIDISSSLYFNAIVSAFIPIKFYDYRPAKLQISHFKADSCDLLNLPFSDNSIKSLSCMHVVEHIGLGRYGDNIDPNGDLKAIKELKRVLENNGQILFVVPVGKPMLRFNAHRIYSYEQIISYFSELTLEQFTLICDDAEIIYNADKTLVAQQNYGCGCFLFRKI